MIKQDRKAGTPRGTPAAADPVHVARIPTGFIILLTALTALGPVSTDFYLPSLPSIARYFSVGEAQAQLTLSAFLVGFAVTMLVFGPLSDRFGRKPVVMGRLLSLTLASIGCRSEEH